MFILIFWTFFKSYPPAFDEAAQIDGAGRFKVFYKIAIPMADPAHCADHAVLFCVVLE